MNNPWLKKNPFMSLWLSGANKAMGSARAQAHAAVKRETRRAGAAVTAAAVDQFVDIWTRSLTKPTAAPRKRRASR